MERAAGLVVSPSVTRDRTRGCCAGEVVTAVNRASGGCVEGVTCQITIFMEIKININIAIMGRKGGVTCQITIFMEIKININIASIGRKGGCHLSDHHVHEY